MWIYCPCQCQLANEDYPIWRALGRDALCLTRSHRCCSLRCQKACILDWTGLEWLAGTASKARASGRLRQRRFSVSACPRVRSQTYVDTILNGCLAWGGEAMARGAHPHAPRVHPRAPACTRVRQTALATTQRALAQDGIGPPAPCRTVFSLILLSPLSLSLCARVHLDHLGLGRVLPE